MRKVFLSNMFIQKIKKGATKYVSDDFSFVHDDVIFPTTCVVENVVEDGDTICFITAVNQNKDGQVNQATLNYEEFKKEIGEILEGKKVSIDFIEIPLFNEYDSIAFNMMFKQVADYIHDGDRLYLDCTFGFKPYVMSMFVAMAYAAKVNEDVEVESVFYSMKYTGFDDPTKINKSTIYDITTLFYLNAIAGDAPRGDRKGMDGLLNFIING